MPGSIPLVAGMLSTVIFAGSALPMLMKAARTHELSSYSLGNLGLANLGNAVHTVYVVHLPPGPIWFLHGFYVVTSVLMLGWYLRYVRPWSRRTPWAGRGRVAAGARDSWGLPAPP